MYIASPYIHTRKRESCASRTFAGTCTNTHPCGSVLYVLYAQPCARTHSLLIGAFLPSRTGPTFRIFVPNAFPDAYTIIVEGFTMVSLQYIRVPLEMISTLANGFGEEAKKVGAPRPTELFCRYNNVCNLQRGWTFPWKKKENQKSNLLEQSF